MATAAPAAAPAQEEASCGGCGKTLESASGGVVVAFGNALWHVECFRCAKCSSTVSADTNLLLLADGSPVCQSCSYSCHVCRNPILDEAIMTGDDSYHAACFKCRSCARRIEELVFAKTSQGIYCMACHNDRVARSRRHAEHKKRSRTRSRKDDSAPQSRATDFPPSPAQPAIPSPSTHLAATPDLGKRRKSYDDGVRPLSSFFNGTASNQTNRSPSAGNSFAAQQSGTGSTPQQSTPSTPGLGVPSQTSRADKRRSINPGLMMPTQTNTSSPNATAAGLRPRGGSVGTQDRSEGDGRLSPSSIHDPQHNSFRTGGADSIRGVGGTGSLSSRAASPSSHRSRFEDIFETGPPPQIPLPQPSRGTSYDTQNPTRQGSFNTRLNSFDTQRDDVISILGPNEGEITMMFEEPSFTLDEPTFVLDEPTVTPGRGRSDEAEVGSVVTGSRGSRIGSLDFGSILAGGGGLGGGTEGTNGVGVTIGRSRSPSFGRSASPSGFDRSASPAGNHGRGRPTSPGGASLTAGLGGAAGPTAGRVMSPTPGLGRAPSPAPASGAGSTSLGRSASPGLGRSVSPGLGRSVSPAPPPVPAPGGTANANGPATTNGRDLGATTNGRSLGRSASPSGRTVGRSVSPGARDASSSSPAPVPAPPFVPPPPPPTQMQGRSASPMVVKSASQGVPTPSASYDTLRGTKAGILAKSASQGATSPPSGSVMSVSSAGGTNGSVARTPVSKGVNGQAGTNGAYGQTNGTYGQNGTLGATQPKPVPSPARSRSGARDSLPPPAVPPKDGAGPGHQHTLSYPALQQNGSYFPGAPSNSSTITPARPRPTRSSSSSSSSPVIESTATFGAMQLPPMRFSLSDTDFTDLLKGVGVDENGKLKLSELGAGRSSLDAKKLESEKSKPLPETSEQDKRRPSVEQDKRRPSVEQEKRRPSVEQEKHRQGQGVDGDRRRPSVEAPEPFPRLSSDTYARPSTSASSDPRASSTSETGATSLFAVIREDEESATASILDDEEEEFGRDTTMTTPIIRTTLAPSGPNSSSNQGAQGSPYLHAGRERLDSAASVAAASEAIVRRLKEMADGAYERGSSSVKINLEFLDAITKAVVGSRDKYSDLKGRYDGMKRTSQQFIDGLSVAQSEYDKELAARRDAEAEVTRLRVQLSGQAARLTAMSAETRIREVGEQQMVDANAAMRGLLQNVAKLRTERDMIIAEIDELGKKSFSSSGNSWEPLEARLETVRKQYRKDLEGLKLQREGLVKEITELKEHRDIFLEETTALNARNEELGELNAQIQRQLEQQMSSSNMSRPTLPHMDSSGGVPTQLSLGSSLKEFGVKNKSAANTTVNANASVSSMQSVATTTTGTLSAGEEKERDREEAKIVRVQTPQEPVSAGTSATTANKGGLKWFKGKAPPKDASSQSSSSVKSAAGLLERPKGYREHNFVQQSVLRFARCDHCGDKMWGMQVRCSNCSIACHPRCMYSIKSSCQSSAVQEEEPVVDISPLPPSMFGRELIEQVRADAKNDPGRMVPIIVDKCIRAVESSAMDYEGIYRKTGGSSQSKAITQLFERGNYNSFDLEDTDSFNDISSITSVMKTYFRQLPDPLLTFALHEKFVEAAAIRDQNAKHEALVSLVNQLPPEHYHTLRFLMLHLSRIKDCSEENLMSARNIGVVFGPTLLRSADPSREFGDMAGKALTVEWLVDNAPTIFSDPPPF